MQVVPFGMGGIQAGRRWGSMKCKLRPLARRPRQLSPGQDVEMEVPDSLAAILSRVNDGAITRVAVPCRTGQPGARHKEVPQQFCIFCPGLR